MKDLSGKEVGAKEFVSRWKAGIQGITPLQMAKSNQWGFYLVMIGIIMGIVTSIINSLWWLLIILCGSTILSGLSMLGNWQKMQVLKQMEDTMKNFSEPTKPEQATYVQ